MVIDTIDLKADQLLASIVSNKLHCSSSYCVSFLSKLYFKFFLSGLQSHDEFDMDWPRIPLERFKTSIQQMNNNSTEEELRDWVDQFKPNGSWFFLS